MTRRLPSMILAALAGLVLAGCGQSEEPTSTAPAASNTPAEPVELTWETSPCSSIDPDALAKTYDVDAATAGGLTTASGLLPIRDACTLTLRTGDSGGPLEIGWSVETIDEAGWTALTDYYEKAQGAYTDIVPLEIDDASAYSCTAPPTLMSATASSRSPIRARRTSTPRPRHRR